MREDAVRAQLIAAGNENLQRFSWDRAAEQTLKVLLES
jgi:hypothetical protein